MLSTLLIPEALIALAAFFWATDPLVRGTLAVGANPKWIVCLEHAIGLLCLLPFAIKKRSSLLPRGSKDWALFALLGVGGSALGGLFYTFSVQAVGASLATLFQMLQPAIVLGLAASLLRERVSSVFVLCAIWVILNSLVISFPDFELGLGASSSQAVGPGALFALLAVLCWGIATVAGKSLLNRYSPLTVVFWRWLFAVAFLLPWALLDSGVGPSVSLHDAFSSGSPGALIYLGSIAGAGAMWIYYQGLRVLPASLVTFIELLYVLAGALLPFLFGGGTIQPIQAFASAALLCSIGIMVTLHRLPDWRQDTVLGSHQGR